MIKKKHLRVDFCHSAVVSSLLSTVKTGRREEEGRSSRPVNTQTKYTVTSLTEEASVCDEVMCGRSSGPRVGLKRQFHK